MKSNVLFVSICVLIVGLFSLCACTATVKGEETDPSDPGTSQPEITGTDPTYGSGLTEKTYDPNAEESGDFGLSRAAIPPRRKTPIPTLMIRNRQEALRALFTRKKMPMTVTGNHGFE